MEFHKVGMNAACGFSSGHPVRLFEGTRLLEDFRSLPTIFGMTNERDS